MNSEQGQSLADTVAPVHFLDESSSGYLLEDLVQVFLQFDVGRSSSDD